MSKAGAGTRYEGERRLMDGRGRASRAEQGLPGSQGSRRWPVPIPTSNDGLQWLLLLPVGSLLTVTREQPPLTKLEKSPCSKKYKLTKKSKTDSHETT